MVDDGRHDDGQAADGVYGVTTAPLNVAGYVIGLRAEVDNQFRATTGWVALPGWIPGSTVSDTQADLSLNIDAPLDAVAMGMEAPFTLTVTNQGPDEATGLTLLDILTEAQQVDSVSASQGTCTTTAFAVSCDLGALPGGMSATVRLNVVPTNPGVLFQTATVSAAIFDPDLSNNTVAVATQVDTRVNVEETGESVPTAFQLHQSYPNPFNPVATIPFEVKEPVRVVLTIYSLMGQRVATLVNRQHAPGRYEVSFDASRLSSGTYFYRIEMGDFRAMKTMVLVK